MRGLRSAVGFLTILPVAPRDASGLDTARVWFPVVGLQIGLVLAAIDVAMHAGYPVFAEEPKGFPPLLAASIIVVAIAALTRCLHLDGFMDCCDALLGGFDRQRRLEILKDSHVGAFAVVGVVCLLLLKVSALLALPSAGRVWMLLLFPCLSRWTMLMALELFPYVRPQGIGTPFLPRKASLKASLKGGWQLAVGLFLALLITVAVAGPWGLVLMAAATGAALLLCAWASRLLGGVTGDVYGAVNETAEVSVLVLAAILTWAVSDTLFEPIHRMGW